MQNEHFVHSRTSNTLKKVLFNKYLKEVFTLPAQGHYTRFFNVNVTIYIIYQLYGTHFIW